MRGIGAEVGRAPELCVAGIKVHDGTVAGWATDSTRSDNFVAFLDDLVDQSAGRARPALHRRQPPSPLHPQGCEFLDTHRHVHLNHTPTHTSCLNQVGLTFSHPRAPLLRRRESTSSTSWPIIAFSKDYNRRAAPFRWTYEGRPLMVV